MYKFIVLILLCLSATVSADELYCWNDSYNHSNTLRARFEPPDGFQRLPAEINSFAYWLSNLPLKENKPNVFLYDGRLKRNQKAHSAVIDIDIGNRDLQQCADAAIRLRAEYFYAHNLYDSIAFNFTSGDRASFRKWIIGYRPKIDGNKVNWHKTAPIDSSYNNFRNYLDIVFTYAGSYSLKKELKQVDNICDIQPGDLFIIGGFPGHAVIVLDVVINVNSGEKLFLLAQSFMPAQNIHLLKNNNNSKISPWYRCDFTGRLKTPEWTFEKSDLMRFK